MAHALLIDDDAGLRARVADDPLPKPSKPSERVTDSIGRVTFTTIRPDGHNGRCPHIHFDVYPRLSVPTDGGAVSVSVAAGYAPTSQWGVAG
jgi:hypothetical protein